MTIFLSGGNVKTQYEKESTYGTKIAAPDGWIGETLSFDPKEEIGQAEHNTLDSGDLEVDDISETIRDYSFTWVFRPQHMVPLAYFFGVDEFVTGTVEMHGSKDLIAPDFGLDSITVESVYDHPTQGHNVWFDGAKMDSFELRIREGTGEDVLSELTTEWIAQDSDSLNDSGQTFESSDAHRKKYTIADRRPYSFKDITAEILATGAAAAGGAVFSDLTEVRIKGTNDLLNAHPLDNTLQGKIAEPDTTRRRFELELTGRMADDTYYDMFKQDQRFGETSGNLDEAGNIDNSQTSFDIDNGSGALVTNMPSIGIIKIDSEYMFFFNVDDNTGAATEHTLTVVRGMYGSSVATHNDNATVTILGGISVVLNKGTVDQLNVGHDSSPTVSGFDFDADDDYAVFTFWGGRVSTFTQPSEHTKDVLEQSFLIKATDCVLTTADDIGVDYLSS